MPKSVRTFWRKSHWAVVLASAIFALGFAIAPSQVSAASLEYLVPGAYDISAGELVDSFTSTPDRIRLTGMAFNNDGSKMYLLDFFYDSIDEYNLSTPYDVSTSVLVDELDISARAGTPNGMTFNNDGTKLYIIDSSNDVVDEYDLSTPFDVSTGVYVHSFSVATEESNPNGLAFNNDGTKLYIVGLISDTVYEYDLSTPFDVSTTSLSSSLDVSPPEFTPEGLTFNNDGSKLYIIGSASDAIHEFDLSTPFDVSTGTYVQDFDVSNETTNPQSMAFNGDGSKFYVLGRAQQKVFEYDIDPGDYPENDADDGSVDNANPLVIILTDDTFQDTDSDNILDVGSEVTIGNVPAGLTPVMTLSEGDTVVTLTFTGNAVDHENLDDIDDLTFVFDDTAFVGGNAATVDNSGDGGAYSSDVGIDFFSTPIPMRYIGPTPYDVSTGVHADEFDVGNQLTSPQGVAFNTEGTRMFVVGSATDSVFMYELEPYQVSTATLLGSFSVAAEETSPQGIAFNDDGTKMYIVGTVGRAIDEYALSTAFDVTTAIFTDSFSVLVQDPSPQGLAFNNDGTKVYVIGDDFNSVYQYDLGVAYDVSSGVFVDSVSVSDQETSPRGVAFNNDGTKLFIIGDDSDRVHEYDLSPPYDLSTAIYVDSLESEEITNTDLAFNDNGSKLFIVGSFWDEVGEYDLSIGNYPEATSNDGAIDVSNPLRIELTGETFQDTDADNILDIGSEVTIGNVPAGLTPVMTLTDGDTVAELTFTGTAAAHADADDVFSLTFVFSNLAFTGADAESVQNSGFDDAYESNMGIDYNDPPVISYNKSEFREHASNDGSIVTTIFVTLEGETFATIGVLLEGGEGDFVANNVPVGLTAEIITTSTTEADFTLTGNAAAHTTSDDIADLEIIWNDSAFTDVAAANITSSTKSDFEVAYRNSSGGGGGGGSSTVPSTTPMIDLTAPTSGQEFAVDSFFDISYEVSGAGISEVDLYVMDSSGVRTDIAPKLGVTESPFNWHVPADLAPGMYDLVAGGYDSGRALLDSDTVEIEIVGLDLVSTDPDLLTEDEIEAGVTIDGEGRKVAPGSGEMGASPFDGSSEEISSVNPGWFIRSYNYSTVYLVTDDGTRRPFWDAQTFMTWADSWGEVIWVTDATLATMSLVEPMLPQPGVVMVKIQSDPRVYWVEEDTDETYVLRWVTSESIASQMFGSGWSDYIIDVDAGIFGNYSVGADVTFAESISTSKLETRAEIASQVAGN